MKRYRNVTVAALALAALALKVSLNQHLGAASFIETGRLNGTRAFHSATLLANGKVLVAGGWDESHALSSAELYNPSTGTWTLTGSLMTTSRLRHTATLLSNGKVLVAGGWDGFNTVPLAELYDPASETWIQTGSMATGRYLHTATLLTNGRVLVTGGFASGMANALANSELYDPATETWTTTGSMSVPRVVHSATLLPNGKVLAAGGANGSGMVLSSAELYDPESGTWTPTGGMNTNRMIHSAMLLANGLVLVTGGSSTTNQVAVTNLSTAELYNPASGTWKATGALSSPRAAPNGTTLLPNGQVLVTGGYGTSGGSSLASAELYDPATGTWTNTGSMNIGRENYRLTLLTNGNVLAAGGAHYEDGVLVSYLSTAEVYDSTSGPISLVHPAKQPGGAFQFAFTAAPFGTNTVLTTTLPASPLANWTALGVVPEFAPGLYLFSAPQATTGLQHFYCVRSP